MGETRRERLLTQIHDTEPAMFRAMGPAHTQEWIAIDLTMSQLKVAFLLYCATQPGEPDGLRVGEVARSLGVTLPTVTAVMDKLVERGLIRRDEDPTDRRQHICRLTPDGSELIGRLVAGRRAYTSRLLAYLDEDSLGLVLQGMRLMIHAAGRLHAGAPPLVAGPVAEGLLAAGPVPATGRIVAAETVGRGVETTGRVSSGPACTDGERHAEGDVALIRDDTAERGSANLRG